MRSPPYIKAVVGALAFIGSAFVLDYAVAWYQTHASEQRRLAQIRLQQAAFATLFVELQDVAYEADGRSYRLTMAMENLDAESPLYVMLSQVRAFEQTGLVWKEVPARAPDGASWGVIKLTDRHTYQTIFRARPRGLDRTHAGLHAHPIRQRHADQPEQRADRRHR